MGDWHWVEMSKTYVHRYIICTFRLSDILTQWQSLADIISVKNVFFFRKCYQMCKKLFTIFHTDRNISDALKRIWNYTVGNGTCNPNFSVTINRSDERREPCPPSINSPGLRSRIFSKKSVVAKIFRITNFVLSQYRIHTRFTHLSVSLWLRRERHWSNLSCTS